MIDSSELRKLAKDVYGPSKDDWELKQALLKFDKAATPENVIRLIDDLHAAQSDPALAFCHRFAVLMECMVLPNKQDPYWAEANNLLAEYNEAQHKWREAMGEPYGSGFGKD